MVEIKSVLQRLYSDGHLIRDTPPHKQGDCGRTNPCTINGIWENSVYNYMSYCPGTEYRFTLRSKR